MAVGEEEVEVEEEESTNERTDTSACTRRRTHAWESYANQRFSPLTNDAQTRLSTPFTALLLLSVLTHVGLDPFTSFLG